jgi:hypothetical protein
LVDELTLADLVKELKSTGPAYRQRVSTVMRASYSHHYRRAIPALLQALEFSFQQPDAPTRDPCPRPH